MKLTKEITNNWVTTKELIEARCVTRAKEKAVIRNNPYPTDIQLYSIFWFDDYIRVLFEGGIEEQTDLDYYEALCTEGEWEKEKLIIKRRINRWNTEKKVAKFKEDTETYWRLKKELGL